MRLYASERPGATEKGTCKSVKQEEYDSEINGSLAESNTRDYHALCVKSTHSIRENCQIPAITMRHGSCVRIFMSKLSLALSAIFCVLIFSLSPAPARAQGTAFAYNGKLDDGTNPANGSYDMSFTLFATNNGGDAIAGPVTNSATGVTNGMFSATIDFGTGVFTGSNYWMELAVRTNGGGSFVTLSPRQPILPNPYAIYSTTGRECRDRHGCRERQYGSRCEHHRYHPAGEFTRRPGHQQFRKLDPGFIQWNCVTYRGANVAGWRRRVGANRLVSL